eukprot:7106014-Pyramimonas_sp.AAC.1
MPRPNAPGALAQGIDMVRYHVSPGPRPLRDHPVLLLQAEDELQHGHFVEDGARSHGLRARERALVLQLP